MALALYRTYRPGSLAEVIGQEHVTEPLTRALQSGRTHHAYLFSGPRGCGKTSTARIIARSLNCEQGPTAQPCGQCRSCIELAPNGPGSMDVVELDAATHRGIDDARELREKAIYAPAASRYKIYIIDEAHQLTNEAANALLKLVEEPPPHLRFIFATTEPDKIIPTIRSRTFHYGFRLVPARTLVTHLGSVCEAEGVPAEQPALAVVARAGAGSVRDSLSVLGQLLAGAGPDGLTYADAISALGLTDTSLIDDFVAALAAGSAADMFGIVDGVIGAGHDPRRFVIDVLDRLRDLIIIRVDHEALAKGLVDVPDDAGQRLVAQAQSLGLAELSRAADLVSAGLGQIKGATAPRLQLELLCARLALPEAGSDLSALLARLDRLERGGAAQPGTAGPGGSTAGGPSADPAHTARGRAAEHPEQQPSGDRAPSATGPGAAWADTPIPDGAPDAPTPGGASAPDVATPDVATTDHSHGRAPAAKGSAAPASPAGDGPTAAPAGARPAPPRRPELRRGRPAGGPSPAETALQPSPAPPHAAPVATAPAAPATAPAPAEAGPSPAEPSGDTQITRIREAWPAILDRLAASSRVAWTAFHAATAVSCSDGALAVAVSEPGNARAIAQRGHDERLRQAIIDVVALDLTIDVLHDPEPASPGRPAPQGSRSGGGPGPAGARSAPGAAGTAPAAGRPPAQDAGSAPSSRPADVVRAAGSTASEEHEVDEPSPDDPDLDAGVADGLALITRELGARPIGEIDHT